MATGKRSNAVVTFEQSGSELRFSAGGQTAVLDMTKVSQTLLDRAIVHGLKQRISDAAAIPCNTETGLPATPAEKFASMLELVEYYNSGTSEWNRPRALGDGTPRTGSTLQAFANVYWEGDLAKAKDKMQAFADKRGSDFAEAVKLWASADKIIEEVARMKATIPAKVDADSLLAELDE